MKKFNSFLVLSLLMLPSLVSNAQEYLRGDVDLDGHVDISDVTCLINYLLKGSWPDADGYEYVDLGLPSGTLWATCNVGANCPEEYGDYFAWSETVPKDEFTYENYKWWSLTRMDIGIYQSTTHAATLDLLTTKRRWSPRTMQPACTWAHRGAYRRWSRLPNSSILVPGSGPKETG